MSKSKRGKKAARPARKTGKRSSSTRKGKSSSKSAAAEVPAQIGPDTDFNKSADAPTDHWHSAPVARGSW